MIFRKLGLSEKAMSEYLAMLQQLHLPHFLILAGVALVLVGAVGIALRPSRDIGLAREVVPSLGTTASEFADGEKRGDWRRSQPPHDEDMSELLDLSAEGTQQRSMR